MAEEIVGLMSPETEKELGAKLQFTNKILELVDDPLISIIDNKIFEPLSKKLPVDILPIVKEALALVISEMPVIVVGKE